MLFGESKKNTPHNYLSFPGQYANKHEKHDWQWPYSGATTTKKILPDGASASPVNSITETSGGTHRLYIHRLFFFSLQRAYRNPMAKWQDRSRACLMLRPSVNSYQCFRGRKKYHTIARKILSFSLFFYPQKSCSKASVLDWSNIPKSRIYCFSASYDQFRHTWYPHSFSV